MHTLFAVKGWGSVIAEAAFTFAGVPYRLDYVDFEKPDAALDRLRAANPLCQLPTVILPDGRIMTESAAIILHLADQAPGAGLVPPAGAASRPEFLRWLIFLVAAVYPTFTYGDDPSRYVESEEARRELRKSTDKLRQQHWQQMEAVAGAPWFLGAERSALDIYVWAMTHWRPGPKWFAEHCPKLTAIAGALDRDERLAGIKAQNWPS